MSLVYTQTATPPSPSHPSFPAPAPDFLATLKGLSALPGFLLRLEFGKQAGDICSFSNSIHLPIHSFLQQRFAKWVSDPMRPQGELGPAPSSGRPGVSAGPQLCSKVPSGKWLDARGLQLPPHPMLVSPRPLVQGPPEKFCQRRKGRASSCLHSPGPRRRVPSLVARGQAGREDMWMQGGGT